MNTGIMKRLPIVLALVAFPLAAQSDYTHTIAALGNVHLIDRHPNCNPLTPAFDPVWVNGWGWTMPRIGWHALYPTVAYGIAQTLTSVGVSRKWAALGVTLGLGLVPHLRQAALGLKHGAVYELNLPDWAFDLWNRSLPTWDMLSREHGHTPRAYAVWLAGDIVLSCFARP